MEEVPDMDDLLDEMESDLMRSRPATTTTTAPAPLLPPTSIGMMPRGYFEPNGLKSGVTVPRFEPGDDLNRSMQGSITLDTAELPNTFQPAVATKIDYCEPPSPQPASSEDEEVPEKDLEMESMLEYLNAPRQNGGRDEIGEFAQKMSEQLVASVENGFCGENLASEEEKVSEVVEAVLEFVKEPEDIYEDAQEICEAPEVTIPALDEVKEASESSEDVQGACEALEVTIPSEENVQQVEDAPEVVREGSESSKEVPENFEAKHDVTEAANISEDVPESSEAPEDVPELSKTHDDVEEAANTSEDVAELHNSSEDVAEASEASEDVPEDSEAKNDVPDALETSEAPEDVPEPSEAPENVSNAPTISEDIPEPSERSAEKIPELSEPYDSPNDVEDVLEATEVSEEMPESEPTENGSSEPFDEQSSEEEVITVIEVVPSQIQISVASENIPEAEDEEEETGRTRFDSSIATVHVLHESDSDETETPRRERRLTESELQLGKTSPYWIPDAECPLCMLCNAKFTIITRRHHCRACGRVLCGSCCSEKAVLEYLQEPGKKTQSVRVCKPCFSMLSRIEAHEADERRRRESVTSSSATDVEAPTSSEDVPVVPRGVLKMRAPEEDGAPSTSGGLTTSAVANSESARRSVVFRDGVRPGAPADEENPEEEKSTALKPKKKSRKRNSVVRRIAELRMEDELACALPKEGHTKVLIIKPDSEQPKFEDATTILETLCNFSVVTVVLKKNLTCSVQIFNNPNFGLVWVVSTTGFAQIGLDELLFSWTLSDKEKQKLDGEEPELDENVALIMLPLAVLRRISMIYTHSTEHEYAGVRRVESRLPRVHSVLTPAYPLTKHVMLFRPTVQAGLDNVRCPTNPFLVACFLHDDELNWATGLPNRLLYKLGEKYNVYPTPFVNQVGRPSLYSTDVSGTVLKVFTDFRSWSYRMRHIPGCTVSLSNEKTIIRIPKSAIADLREVLSVSRSMVAWSCDLNHDDDSVLICEETDPGLYSTQVFAKYIGQRESTSASFVILDGGSKVNQLQVNVVEDGVAIRVQSERLETILNAINEGHDVVETAKDMQFRVEFVEDGDWISADNKYYAKSQIDGLFLMNKFQYGLSLERALTQVLQVQGISDYGVRMSHVYNLGEGRLQPEEEPKIYGMVEIAARECVAMLEPHMQFLIRAGIGSLSIRLFVSPYEFEYEVSSWLGLEDENNKYKQSLDQLIPMLYNMIEYVPNGFEVEFVLSIVSTRALPI